MVVFNQFCALLLGIHLLGCVQCQRDSCTLEEFRQSDMFDEHFDLSNLAATYTLGKSVRVPCQVGYRGFFRLVCSDRGWTKHGAICKKVLCGHPGDVQFADFQLVKGTDYDFGSRVQYTCHKGYQMTSYTSTRNCLERGWDGHLPECEPISCPSLTVDRNVLVYGDMDQATSGSVLQFSCSSRNDELDGPTQLICDDNGNWDKSPPTCRAISCSVPPLENFIVEGEKQEYKKDEFLTYNCNFGYRKMDGRPSQCKKVGQTSQWAPMPRCEEIKCKLGFNPPEETTYNPQNQIIFKVGKTVNVTCGEKYWVKNIELQSAELTCQVTGDWDFQPLCRPVTCSKNDERIKHVYSWGTRLNTVDMDETLTYQCQWNYFKTSPRATCTRRGWEPNPLCEEILCPEPPPKYFTVEGEKTVYRNNEVLTYSCDPGYRKVHNEPTKCKEKDYSSQWIPAPQCEEITCKLSSNPPEETTYNPQNQIIFKVGETVNVSCGEKHWVKNIELQSAELTCLEEKQNWDFAPVCTPVTCSKYDERIKDVYSWQRIRYNTVDMDETLTYQCRTDYVETSPGATCTRRGWVPNPLCEEISCPKPQSGNFTMQGEETVYKNNEVLIYSCNPGYNKTDQRPPRCLKKGHSSQWIPAPYCEEIICKLSSNPPQETTYNPQNQIIFRPGQTVTVSCDEKHWVKNIELQSAELTCLEDTGDWDFYPVCQQVTCLKGAEHVIYWDSQWSRFSLDDTVLYRCNPNSVETSLRATCTRGGWEPKPLCKEILCPKPPLLNFEVEGEKTEYRQDDELTYSCNPGYRKVNESQSRCKIEQRSPQWTPAPKCEPKTCELVPNPSEQATYNPQNKTIFRPGESVTVSCGEDRLVNSTCQEETGDWDNEPVCKPVTCHKHDGKHVEHWEDNSRISINLGETLWYRCFSRYRATSPTHTAKCTREGWKPHPLCKHYSSQ